MWPEDDFDDALLKGPPKGYMVSTAAPLYQGLVGSWSQSTEVSSWILDEKCMYLCTHVFR